ncbi:MAG: RNA polymerase sigma factor [Pseudomonadota bacterium]
MTSDDDGGDRTPLRLPRNDETVFQNPLFLRIYKRLYQKLVDGLRGTYGAGPPDPEEVAQTAFVKLAQRGRLDEIKDVEGFVWISARNIVLTEKRKEIVRQENQPEISRRFFGEDCDTFEPERVLNAREQLEIVMSVLAEMPERRQRIFMLNRIHGLTPAEAGRRCGVSRTAAVRHIALATKALVVALTDESASLEGDP